jgi:hypothetical protein
VRRLKRLGASAAQIKTLRDSIANGKPGAAKLPAALAAPAVLSADTSAAALLRAFASRIQ